MATNGAKNYNYWNVVHWFSTDERLMIQVREAIKSLVDKDKAAKYLIDTLPETTPDGVKYTFRNVRRALKEFDVN